jgi:hypothetical protein
VAIAAASSCGSRLARYCGSITGRSCCSELVTSGGNSARMYGPIDDAKPVSIKRCKSASGVNLWSEMTSSHSLYRFIISLRFSFSDKDSNWKEASFLTHASNVIMPDIATTTIITNCAKDAVILLWNLCLGACARRGGAPQPAALDAGSATERRSRQSGAAQPGKIAQQLCLLLLGTPLIHWVQVPKE